MSFAKALIVFCAAVAAVAAQDDAMERAIRAHAEFPMIDGHNDLPWKFRSLVDNRNSEVDLTVGFPGMQTDIKKMREGGMGAQFWVSYAPCDTMDRDSVRINLEQIDQIHRMIDQYPEHFGLALTADEIEEVFSQGKIASLIGVEGGHGIDNSLAPLRMFYNLGARYMTLTHNCDLLWIDHHAGSHPIGGITDFGAEVVREMNRLGMMIDIAHISADAMRDVAEVSVAPIFSSHSNAYTQCEHTRNVPDDVLLKIKEKGGLIMVNFLTSFVCSTGARVTMEDVANHIDYVRDFIGVDYIGYGSDYDGGATWPVGLEDPSQYHNLTAELFRRNYTDTDVQKIIGGNFLRFMRTVEKFAADLQDGTIPSETTFYPDLPCRSRSEVADFQAHGFEEEDHI